MNDKERAVMQQALEALEVSTDWDVGAKGKQLQSMKAITALREALADPDIEEMTLTQIAARHEQAKQEPVKCVKCNAEVPLYKNGMCEVCDFGSNQAEQESIGNISLWHNHGYQNHNVEYYGNLSDGLHQLYAAPVRTKDLTAQEKANIIYAADHRNPMAMIYAAIALYRKKNK